MSVFADGFDHNHPLDYPEDYLWIRKADGKLTCRDREDLYDLQSRKREPLEPVEQQLLDQPEDLSKVLACLGAYPIEVSGEGHTFSWNYDPRECL